MIATLNGRLKAREAGRIVVETGGVGYEVFVPLSTYYGLPPMGAPVELEIRQVVREDALMLYGFLSVAEKHAFDLLMRVQHVGPKLALAILSVLSPEELLAAITREDVARIDAVPGVGPKVAERVVRELRDKVSELRLLAPGVESGGAGSGARDGAAGASAPGPLDDAISALVNLGYKPGEAKRAVDSVMARRAAAARMAADVIATGADAAERGAAGGDPGVNLEAVIRESLAVLLGER
jgi:Holliday junction DNA helicase RuvA